MRDLTRDEVLDLFRVAASLQAGVWHRSSALSGTIVLTAFFEASTRTRLSFESAAHRLGASVISIPDARLSSVCKGESLADTGVMLSAYADVVVLRHPAEESVHEIRATEFDIPLVNGGNGCDEHPTQALADWYALLKWRPELWASGPAADQRISLGVLGTPRRMRAQRSFLLMALTHFSDALRGLTVVSESADPLDAELLRAVECSGLDVVYASGLDGHVERFDVIYQNSVALVGEQYERLDAGLRLDADTPLKPGAVVLHPLARLHELSDQLDGTGHNLYFDQARGAVFVRQALLLALMGRLGPEPRHGDVALRGHPHARLSDRP
ncbi:aspartate/ornithine carbamoyltransferase family protein [Actinomycetota bacterium Odt1-20B]